MQFEESQNKNIKELNLFTLPSTQNAVKRLQWVEVRPLGQVLENAPIDFVIPGNGSDYIDLKRSHLNVHLKVVKGDGSDMPADAHVSIINNILQSMWSQVDTFLNQQLVSSSTNNYAYKAYFDTLLSNDKNAKETRLGTQGWHKDTAGYMDETNIEVFVSLTLVRGSWSWSWAQDSWCLF